MTPSRMTVVSNKLPPMPRSRTLEDEWLSLLLYAVASTEVEDENATALKPVMLAPRLSRLVLTVRGSTGLANAVQFYGESIGLPVLRVTDDWAELDAGNHLTLHLLKSEKEGELSTGYSPMVTFEIDDMDATIASCAQAGAHLDGPIQYPAHGKVAALRAPDGHMIGLYEPTR